VLTQRLQAWQAAASAPKEMSEAAKKFLAEKEAQLAKEALLPEAEVCVLTFTVPDVN
jgi:hypothetical protein